MMRKVLGFLAIALVAIGLIVAPQVQAADKSGKVWPNNSVGNLVSKPSFDYKVVRYLEGEARIILTVAFPSASKQQIQSYFQVIAQEVKNAYPNASLDEKWDRDSVWGHSFSFKNETGMYTDVTLKWYADSDPELIIEKRLK
jgi:hypothetical protein